MRRLLLLDTPLRHLSFWAADDDIIARTDAALAPLPDEDDELGAGPGRTGWREEGGNDDEGR